MKGRIYINDFVEDLNYRCVILYIGHVNYFKIIKALQKDNIGKIHRLEFAINKQDLNMRNLIYVENCDLQDLDYPLYEYLKDGYDVYILHEDNGKFYVESKL